MYGSLSRCGPSMPRMNTAHAPFSLPKFISSMDSWSDIVGRTTAQRRRPPPCR